MLNKHFIKLKSLFLFGGICLTANLSFAQVDGFEDFDKRLSKKIVRSSYEKTYKRAERFLDKEIKKQRKHGFVKKEITPLEWWKQEYLMTMDPTIGRPTSEVLFPWILRLTKDADQKVAKRATPGSTKFPWITRGPNDIGGRTRALMWDAADNKQLRVFAGGVTGGLWVNDDISDAKSEWKLVSGLWNNLNVTCIAQDPNNTDIMYVGTGEGFGTTSSSSRGMGIFKSTNGGKNWSQLSGTEDIHYINDIAVRDESGTSVLYVAADILFYQGAWHGTSSNVGLLRSTNGGSTFSNVSPFIPSQSQKYVVSDIEIGPDNRLWVGTRKNAYLSGTDQGGGRILYSDNGTTFTESYKNANALKGRVELACAPSTKDTLYAVIEANGVAQNVVRSFNGGTTWNAFTEPADADNGIPNTDFTRNQAWYDLIIAVNPVDASELVIGGINFFMSTQAGNNWKQISKWSNNPGMDQLSCSYVHADMHAAMYSKDGKRLVVGTDGGVFYAKDIQNNPWNSSTAFEERNNKYVITQYYSGSIAQGNENFMMGGAQDNGTSYTQDTGFNEKRMLFGGDGGYCFIHPEDDEALVFSYVKNNFYSYISGSFYTLAQDNNTGSFINPAGLDFVNNNLWMQKGKGTLYRNDIYGDPSSLSTVTFVSGNDLASAFHFIKIKSTGKARMFIGTSLGNVFVSNNIETSVPTFTQLGSVNSGNISSISTLPDSEDTLILTLTNYGINNVYLSTNAGNNWTAIDGDLPNMPVWDAVLNPFNRKEAIIATELGMFQCENIYSSSPKWVPIQAGMGPVKTMMLDYNVKNGVIMAATHGRGIFTSNAWILDEPMAYFSLNDTQVCVGSEVSLIDSSVNNKDGRTWEINTSNVSYINGTNKNSENADVKFNVAGTYKIRLIATTGALNDTIEKTISVLEAYNNSVSLSASKSEYCNNDDVYLLAKLGNNDVKTLGFYQLKWYLNGDNSMLTSQTNLDTLYLPKPINSGDEYYVTFESEYACLNPDTSKSSTYTVITGSSDTLSIYRVWDTLFTTYKGNGVVSWYRNGLKVATGLRYTLIDNGEFYAKVTNSTCAGKPSNTIIYNSLTTKLSDFGLQIGPNPTNGIINLYAAQPKNLSISLWSLNGSQLIDYGKIRIMSQESIKLTATPGQYILKLVGESGNVINFPLIILE